MATLILSCRCVHLQYCVRWPAWSENDIFVQRLQITCLSVLGECFQEFGSGLGCLSRGDMIGRLGDHMMEMKGRSAVSYLRRP